MYARIRRVPLRCSPPPPGCRLPLRRIIAPPSNARGASHGAVRCFTSANMTSSSREDVSPTPGSRPSLLLCIRLWLTHSPYPTPRPLSDCVRAAVPVVTGQQLHAVNLGLNASVPLAVCRYALACLVRTAVDCSPPTPGFASPDLVDEMQ